MGYEIFPCVCTAFGSNLPFLKNTYDSNCIDLVVTSGRRCSVTDYVKRMHLKCLVTKERKVKKVTNKTKNWQHNVNMMINRSSMFSIAASGDLTLSGSSYEVKLCFT